MYILEAKLITAARAESGVSGYYRLDSPTTCERIRMACQDKFVQQVWGWVVGVVVRVVMVTVL